MDRTQAGTILSNTAKGEEGGTAPPRSQEQAEHEMSTTTITRHPPPLFFCSGCRKHCASFLHPLVLIHAHVRRISSTDPPGSPQPFEEEKGTISNECHKTDDAQKTPQSPPSTPSYACDNVGLHVSQNDKSATDDTTNRQPDPPLECTEDK